MLTNRKKLRDRRKKIKIVVFSAIFILLSTVFLGYWIWITILSKTHYISPLASKILSTEGEKQEKGIAKLEELLREKEIEFNNINSSDSKYTIHLKNNTDVIISQTKDLNTQISSLQFILHRLTMEGRQFKKLDLQYDKPVIVFE